MYSLRRGPQVGGSGDRRTKGKLEEPYIALRAMITEITANRPVGGLQMVKTHASKPKVGSGPTRRQTDNRVAAHMLCSVCRVKFAFTLYQALAGATRGPIGQKQISAICNYN